MAERKRTRRAGDTLPAMPSDTIEETVAQIARMHAEHVMRTPRLQRVLAGITAFIARPAFAAWLSVGMALWIVWNVLAPSLGMKPPDAAPFVWLQGAVGLLALYTTLLILATQRRDDELADDREQLTLQLALLSERKLAKIIDLIEEMRRDSPTLRDRDDDVAAEMARPADAQSVISAIRANAEK